MESRLLEILVCPVCKSSLRYDRQRQELVCRADRLAFPIRDGVPILLEGEARGINPASRTSSEPPPSGDEGAETSQPDSRS